ncbi:regulatory protein RecX [Chloroflexota bacterium]
MARVTAIRAGKSPSRRVNLFLDGRFALSLDTEVAVKENLRVGRDLSDNEIETLNRSDNFRRCLNAAEHYLSYRPRSESEVEARLSRRGFDTGSIKAVLALLKEQNLVDDFAFAQFWRDGRQSSRPGSRWLTRLELRQKGIAEDIIDRVVDTVDDDDNAYRAAAGKLRSLPLSDYPNFRRRLGEYLKRRGFSYEVINNTVKRIWQEQGDPVLDDTLH